MSFGIIHFYYVSMTEHKDTKSLENLHSHKTYKTYTNVKSFDREKCKISRVNNMSFYATNWKSKLQLNTAIFGCNCNNLTGTTWQEPLIAHCYYLSSFPEYQTTLVWSIRNREVAVIKPNDLDLQQVMEIFLNILFHATENLSIQEPRLMLTNPSDAFRGHARSSYINVVPFDMLGICKMFHFETFDFRNAVTLKTGLGVHQGHWKCHHSTECIWLPIDVL